MADALRVAGTFLAVLVVVVAAAAAGPLVLGNEKGPGDAEPAADVGVPGAFAPDATQVDASSGTGEVSVDAESEGAVVVIDAAHGTGIGSEQVQTLERVLVENGYEIRYHDGGASGGTPSPPTGGTSPLPVGALDATPAARQVSGPSPFGPGSSSGGSSLNASLRAADAYVVVAPSQPFTADERAGVEAFAEAGGRVLVLAEPKSLSLLEVLAQALGGGSSGPGNPLAPLTSQFGLSAGTEYLSNLRRNGGNHQTVLATPGDAAGDLTAGVERVSLHRAASVTGGPETSVALRAVAGTTRSTSSVAARYPVAVRNGNVTLVGDASFLSQGNLRDADNEVLVGNLVEFLVGGDVAPGVPAPPEPPQPPTGPTPPTLPGNGTNVTTTPPAG
jgi:hypothetical protein